MPGRGPSAEALSSRPCLAFNGGGARPARTRACSLLLLRLVLGVVLSVVLRCLGMVLSGLAGMPMRRGGMMPRLLMAPGLMMLSCLAMMPGGLLMMACGLVVVFGALMSGHVLGPFGLDPSGHEAGP